MPRFLFVVLIGLLAGPCAYAQVAGTKPLRVLFVGNDLLSHTDVPAQLAKLAPAMGRAATIESVTERSFSLDDHWRDGRAAAALAKGWDVVVLQQSAHLPAGGREELMRSVKRFVNAIRGAGAKPALLMPWVTSDRPGDFPEVIAAYRAAAESVDAVLIPAGEAWLRAIAADRRLRLYSDPAHPSSLGSDLTVLAIWFALFPAGPREFDQAYVDRIGKVLEIPTERRDLLLDVATRAIDEPISLK